MSWKTTKIGEGEQAKESVLLGDNGGPVWIDDDGSESEINWPQAKKKISDLIAGEKTWRQKHKEAEDGFAVFREKFKNIDDPEAYIKAKEQVDKLSAKKLIDAGEVDKVKDEIKKVYEEKNTSLQQKLDEVQKLLEKTTQEKDGQIYRLIVSNRFASSPFLKEKVLVPADMIETVFGKNFKVEDGKPIGYLPDGNKIYSKKLPGEPADFEEAISALIDQYPNKGQILKGTQQSGGGTQGSNGGAAKTYRTIKDFDSNKEKTDFISRHGYGEYKKIVDATTPSAA